MMDHPLKTHEQRLPYGLWVNSDKNTETLFDRSYTGIATRNLERPWEIEFHFPRKFADYTFEGWFYDDSNSPAVDYSTGLYCKVILGEFVSGLDVRDYLLDSRRPGIEPSNYLPRPPISLAEIQLANR